MSIPTALFVGDVSWDLTLPVDHVPAPDEKVHEGHGGAWWRRRQCGGRGYLGRRFGKDGDWMW